MAKQPTNTHDDIWQHLISTQQEASNKLDLRIGNADTHWATIHACEDAILGLNARGFYDVLRKLMILWPDTSGDTPLAKQQQRILQDIAFLAGPLDLPRA